MSYAHETCCAHLKIQYCREFLDGLTHDWWECADCKMLFAPQGRASLPQWIPISERMPTREDANGHLTVWAVDEYGTHWAWAFHSSPVSQFAHPPIAWLPHPRYAPPKPGPTDDECDAIYTYVEYIARQGKDEVRIQLRRWFADVTARIEREKGK